MRRLMGWVTSLLGLLLLPIVFGIFRMAVIWLSGLLDRYAAWLVHLADRLDLGIYALVGGALVYAWTKLWIGWSEKVIVSRQGRRYLVTGILSFVMIPVSVVSFILAADRIPAFYSLLERIGIIITPGEDFPLVNVMLSTAYAMGVFGVTEIVYSHYMRLGQTVEEISSRMDIDTDD